VGEFVGEFAHGEGEIPCVYKQSFHKFWKKNASENVLTSEKNILLTYFGQHLDLWTLMCGNKIRTAGIFRYFFIYLYFMELNVREQNPQCRLCVCVCVCVCVFKSLFVQ
jgi:hypothetical protein